MRDSQTYQVNKYSSFATKKQNTIRSEKTARQIKLFYNLKVSIFAISNDSRFVFHLLSTK